MKRIPVILLLIMIIACPATFLSSCTKTPEEPPVVEPDGSIRLRSEAVQNLKVGDFLKIVYDARYKGANAKDDVVFVSSDSEVVTVDEYGNVVAVGGGTAIITIMLEQDNSIKQEMTCNVAETLFNMMIGYGQGNVDLSTADSKGWIHILPGSQTQALLSKSSTQWYFKCFIEHTGDTGADSSGRWGIGSFLVDDSHQIGEVMSWFGLKPTNHATKTYTPYVGGWRVQSSGNDPEIDIAGPIGQAHEATLEVIRDDENMYCTITVGEEIVKYVYYCPSLKGKPTYPGVYSQKQELYASEFEATFKLEEVQQKLAEFQVAEEIDINGLSDVLYNNSEYKLSANILPSTTYNKEAIFTLKESVSGVNITEDGTLTINSGISGSVTVIATSVSNSEVSTERTFIIREKAVSTHSVFDTDYINANAADYTITENNLKFNGTGDVYIPLLTNGDKWAVSFTANLTTGVYGLYGITNGYLDYTSITFKNNIVNFATMTEDITDVNINKGNEITIIRDLDKYLVIVDGKLIDCVSIDFVESVPTIFASNALGDINNVTLITDSAAIDSIINAHPFTIGKLVTVNNDGSYTLKQHNFGSNIADINWPPVNNYENGLQSAKSFNGNFDIEFTLSNVLPMLNSGKVDSKILVYLKSESKTASIQFVLKGDSLDRVSVLFCPNLDDATWNEYNASELNLLGDEPIKFRIEKRSEGVNIYINDALSFTDIAGMSNNGFWTDDTVMTPGIGSFFCGVTVSDLKFIEK